MLAPAKDNDKIYENAKILHFSHIWGPFCPFFGQTKIFLENLPLSPFPISRSLILLEKN